MGNRAEVKAALCGEVHAVRSGEMKGAKRMTSAKEVSKASCRKRKEEMNVSCEEV